MGNTLGWLKNIFKKHSLSSPCTSTRHIFVDRLTYEILRSSDKLVIIAPDVDPIYIEIKHKNKCPKECY